jgi:hypothetical protein
MANQSWKFKPGKLSVPTMDADKNPLTSPEMSSAKPVKGMNTSDLMGSIRKYNEGVRDRSLGSNRMPGQGSTNYVGDGQSQLYTSTQYGPNGPVQKVYSMPYQGGVGIRDEIKEVSAVGGDRFETVSAEVSRPPLQPQELMARMRKAQQANINRTGMMNRIRRMIGR